ncbi:hypothetical protein QL285_031781 [Trifolium repens]|nr:hypothetical protein QL285_031781 [Trifolium repens]
MRYLSLHFLQVKRFLFPHMLQSAETRKKETRPVALHLPLFNCTIPVLLIPISNIRNQTTAVKILSSFSIHIPLDIQIQKSSHCNSPSLSFLWTSLPTFELLSFDETCYRKWRNPDKTQNRDAYAVIYLIDTILNSCMFNFLFMFAN